MLPWFKPTPPLSWVLHPLHLSLHFSSTKPSIDASNTVLLMLLPS